MTDDDSYLKDTSKDFICLLCSDRIILYSIKGLRNLPVIFSTQIKEERVIPLRAVGLECDGMKVRQLLLTYQDCLSISPFLKDELKILSLSKAGHLLKLSHDMGN
jgi:hypothetical protein